MSLKVSDNVENLRFRFMKSIVNHLENDLLLGNKCRTYAFMRSNGLPHYKIFLFDKMWQLQYDSKLTPWKQKIFLNHLIHTAYQNSSCVSIYKVDTGHYYLWLLLCCIQWCHTALPATVRTPRRTAPTREFVWEGVCEISSRAPRSTPAPPPPDSPASPPPLKRSVWDMSQYERRGGRARHA